MDLGVAALTCLAIATALLVRLHTLPTGLSPVRDAVSDYGTTRFHLFYRAMAVALGLAAALLAVALRRETNASALLWLWLFAGARVAIAGFMTDPPGAPPLSSTEGRIHFGLAALAFTSIALAASNVDWTGAPSALPVVGEAVWIAALATLACAVLAPLRRMFGVAERLLYAAFVAWLAVGAAGVV